MFNTYVSWSESGVQAWTFKFWLRLRLLLLTFTIPGSGSGPGSDLTLDGPDFSSDLSRFWCISESINIDALCYKFTTKTGVIYDL